MADMTSSIEQRCLKLITLAESAAKEQQAKFLEEIETLEEQLRGRDHLVENELQKWESGLEKATSSLGEHAQVFSQRNASTHHLLDGIARQREQSESRLIAGVKDLLHWFHRFSTFDRTRRIQAGYQDYYNGKGLPGGKISANVTFNEFIHFIVESNSTAIPADTVETLRHAMRTDDGAVEVEGQEGTPQRQWVPTPREVELLDGVSVAAMESGTLRKYVNGDDVEKEISFSMQSVLLYMCGAVELLESFSSRITHLGQQIAAKAEERIAGRLLSKERELLRQTIEPLARTTVELKPEALALVLLQQIHDDREGRQVRMMMAHTESLESQKASHDAYLRDLRHAFREHVLPMVMDGLYVDQNQYKRRMYRGSEGFLAHNGHLGGRVSASDDPHVLIPASSSRSSRRARSPERAGSPTRTGQELEVVLLQPKSNQMLYTMMSQVGKLEENTLRTIVDQHHDDYSTLHGEYSVMFDRLKREMNTTREVHFVENVTVFNLDDIAGEIERREFVQRISHERLHSVRTQHRSEVSALTTEIEALKGQVTELRRQLIAAEEKASRSNHEAERLSDVLSARKESDGVTAMVRETRVIAYELNEESFGNAWQLSLLKLRERVHNEIFTENNRMLTKVKNLMWHMQLDTDNLETLYQERMDATLKQIEQDNANKAEMTRLRYETQIERLEDQYEQRIRNESLEHEAHLQQLREEQEKYYSDRIAELNELYAERIRKVNRRAEEQEERFDRTVKQLRRRAREKEDEIEERFSERFSEMFAYFEEEASRLKEYYANRQRELDRQRLVMETNLERRLNDKAKEVRTEFEALAQKLQNLTIEYLGSQRDEFDIQREEEMATMRMFHRIDNHHHKAKALENLRELQKHHEGAINNMRLQQEEQLIALKKDLTKEMDNRETIALARLAEVKAHQEEVLRVTQDLRVEQDEAFWGQCHDRLTEAEEEVVAQRAKLELLLQERYGSLVKACEDLLGGEIAARRNSFEREQTIRLRHLHRYSQHYHVIQLHLEQSMWAEVNARAAIEKDFYAIHASLIAQEAERRRNLEVLIERKNEPFDEINTVPVEEVRRVREMYEQRLLDTNKYSSTIMADYLTALETEMKTVMGRLANGESAMTAQLFATVDAMQAKNEAYNQSRMFVVENQLSKIATAAEKAIVDSALRDQRSYFRKLAETKALDDAISGGKIRGQQQRSASEAGRASPSGKRTPAGRRGRGKDNTPENRGSGGKRAHTTSPTPNRKVLASANRNSSASPKRKPVDQHDDSQAGSGMNQSISMSAATPARQTIYRDHPGEFPVSPVTQSLSLMPEHVTQEQASTAYLSDEVRVLDYFTSIKAVIHKTMAEMEQKMEANNDESSRQSREDLRRIHAEYVETTSALMKRMEGLQLQNDAHVLALMEAESKLVAKTSEIEVNTKIREDLESLLTDEMSSKQKKLSEGGNIGTLDLDLTTPKPLHLGGPSDDVPLHLQPVTVPRRVLMDVTALRERVFCNEWVHFMPLSEEEDAAVNAAGTKGRDRQAHASNVEASKDWLNFSKVMDTAATPKRPETPRPRGATVTDGSPSDRGSRQRAMSAGPRRRASMASNPNAPKAKWAR